MNKLTDIQSGDSIILDIAPHRQRNSDCVITCYTTVSNWKKRNCYMVMLQKLQLYGLDSSFSQMMEYYHGLLLTHGVYTDTKEFHSFLREQLAMGNPVTVSKSTDTMPWSPFFQKLDLNHAIIVIGIEQQKLIVIDPLFSYDRHLVTLEGTPEQPISYAVIEFGQDRETKFNAFTILHHYLNEYCTVSHKDDENLSNYVELLHMDIGQGHEGKLYQHPAVTKMQTAEDGKECLAVLLESLQETFICDFQESIFALRELKDSWCVLKAQATKALIMNSIDDDLPFLLLRLLAITQEERTVFARILGIITKRSQTKGE